MGMWSTPWENEDKANSFTEMMKKPWLAEVTPDVHDPEFFQANAPGIGSSFRDKECLIGLDTLQDLMSDKAEELKKDFDIRDSIKESIIPELNHMESQIYLPKNLVPINIVREVLGLPKLEKERALKEFQTIGINIVRKFKEANIKIKHLSLQTYTSPRSAMSDSVLGIPDGLEDKTIYKLVIDTVEEKEHEIDFKMIEEIKKIQYDRPGLAGIYYVL
jgi:hypothetical protein